MRQQLWILRIERIFGRLVRKTGIRLLRAPANEFNVGVPEGYALVRIKGSAPETGYGLAQEAMLIRRREYTPRPR